jgi:phosphoglycolate phosphatase
MPTLAIFDLDGTLADSFPWFVRELERRRRRVRLRRVGAAEIAALRSAAPGRS